MPSSRRIFPTQGSTLYLLRLLHCRWVLYRWATGDAPYLRRQITAKTGTDSKMLGGKKKCREGRYSAHCRNPRIYSFNHFLNTNVSSMYLLSASHSNRHCLFRSPESRSCCARWEFIWDPRYYFGPQLWTARSPHLENRLLVAERRRASWPLLAPGSSLRVVHRGQYGSRGVLRPGPVMVRCPVGS